MSLLSKLLSGKMPTLSDVVDMLQAKDQASADPVGHAQSASQHSSKPAQDPVRPSEAPAGFSWGREMPNEPNQYNYYGTFWEYFEDIFQRDFPEYSFTRKENPRSMSVYTYYFSQGDKTVLVLELLSEHNEVYKLREECRERQIPYLRFYYDHDGWWNTRAYVIDRMRKALGR